MTELFDELMDIETPQDEVSLADFEELCKEALEQKKKVDALSKELDAEKAILEAHKKKILSIMTATNKEKYSVKGLGNIKVQSKMSVTVPKGEDKMKFAGYLETIGIEKELRTYNSATINAWYNDLRELCAAEGKPVPEIPGLVEPKEYKVLSLTK